MLKWGRNTLSLPTCLCIIISSMSLSSSKILHVSNERLVFLTIFWTVLKLPSWNYLRWSWTTSVLVNGRLIRKINPNCNLICSFPVVIVYFFLNYLQTCFEKFWFECHAPNLVKPCIHSHLSDHIWARLPRSSFHTWIDTRWRIQRNCFVAYQAPFVLTFK